MLAQLIASLVDGHTGLKVVDTAEDEVDWGAGSQTSGFDPATLGHI